MIVMTSMNLFDLKMLGRQPKNRRRVVVQIWCSKVYNIYWWYLCKHHLDFNSNAMSYCWHRYRPYSIKQQHSSQAPIHKPFHLNVHDANPYRSKIEKICKFAPIQTIDLNGHGHIKRRTLPDCTSSRFNFIEHDIIPTDQPACISIPMREFPAAASPSLFIGAFLCSCEINRVLFNLPPFFFCYRGSPHPKPCQMLPRRNLFKARAFLCISSRMVSPISMLL